MEHKHRTWLCSVLFLDIVGYSTLTVEQQIEVREHFYALIDDAMKNCSHEECITLDAGDGMAICYVGDPEDILLMAVGLRDTFRDRTSAASTPYSVRLGLNLGPVKIVELQGERRVIGDAINVAQRIMDFAQPNQLLVSRSFYDVVSCVSDDYRRMFSYLGLRADKHVRKHAVYEVVPAGARMNEETQSREEAAEPDISHPAAGDSAPSLIGDSDLKRVEDELASYVGPMAHILVRNAARRTGNLDELYRILAKEVPTEEQQRQFLGAHRVLH